MGLIPGLGTKIPHAARWGQKNKKQAGEGVEQKEPSYTAGWDISWCSHYGE